MKVTGTVTVSKTLSTIMKAMQGCESEIDTLLNDLWNEAYEEGRSAGIEEEQDRQAQEKQ